MRIWSSAGFNRAPTAGNGRRRAGGEGGCGGARRQGTADREAGGLGGAGGRTRKSASAARAGGARASRYERPLPGALGCGDPPATIQPTPNGMRRSALLARCR